MADAPDFSSASTGGAGGRSPSRTRLLGILALALLAPIWGYGWVVTKVALTYSDPILFAALRMPISAAFLFLVMIALRRPLRPPPLKYTVLVGLLQTTIFVAFSTIALDHAGAGKVSVLTYTMPFWLLLLAWGFLHERLQGLQWPAVVLSFVGLLLVVQPWAFEGIASGVLTVLGGLSWATSALIVKLLQRKQPLDVLALTAWQMAFGSIALVILAVITYDGGPQWTLGFIASWSYTVVLANALAWFLWLFALHSLPAGAAGLGTLAIPVVGVLTAWIQLHEVPSPAEAVGMLLIILALALLAWHGLRAGRGCGGPAGANPGGRSSPD
jgi:drug/metabolite transporter (DMT)-like permease